MKGKPWSYAKPRFTPEYIAAADQANIAAAKRILSNPSRHNLMQIAWSQRIMARHEPGSPERIVKSV